MLVIKCEKLAVPGGEIEQGPFFVSVEGEVIAGISREEQPEFEAASTRQCLHTHLLAPGFIDLHTHGVGGGEDVMDFWRHPEYTQKLFPAQATTSFLATVVFPRDYPEKTSSVLASLREAVGKTPAGGGAVLEGVHAEGPIVHDLGAMPPTNSDLMLTEFEQLLDSIPRLKVMTISPHLEAQVNYQRLRKLVERGVVPALGHDRVATEAEIVGALACSQKQLHITHLFNVCSFHHRMPSLVNFGLCSELPDQPQYAGLSSPTVELVGDLAHVHPMVLATTLKARHFRDVIFVSDSVLEPKAGAVVNYLDRKIQVSGDCRSLSLVNENVLAGSCCTLLNTFHSLLSVLSVPVGHAIAMLAENPARIAGLSHVGSIEVGKRADLLLLDTGMNLTHTVVAGRVVYQAN